MSKDINNKYLKYAELLSSVTEYERDIKNQKRNLVEVKQSLVDEEVDGIGTEITAHAFRMISERLETLALENPIIFEDVFRVDDPSKSLVMPSNMKSFVISLLAQARSEGMFTDESSRNGGVECKYVITIGKWSGEKSLQFVGIVEGAHIKTGYFNWI